MWKRNFYRFNDSFVTSFSLVLFLRKHFGNKIIKAHINFDQKLNLLLFVRCSLILISFLVISQLLRSAQFSTLENKLFDKTVCRSWIISGIRELR